MVIGELLHSVELRVIETPPLVDAQATPANPCSNSLLLVFLSFSCLVRLQGGGEPEQRSVGPSRTTTVSPSRTQPHKASAQSHHLVLHVVTTVSARMTGGGKEAKIKT